MEPNLCEAVDWVVTLVPGEPIDWNLMLRFQQKVLAIMDYVARLEQENRELKNAVQTS